MRAHEFATYLSKLARILKQGPDFDFNEARDTDRFYTHVIRQKNRGNSSENLPIALNALLSLSQFDKTEWINLIRELNFPIEIRPRDASRDLLGKVLKVLEMDPDARDQLTRRVRLSSDRASPELMRALSSLLSK